MRKLLTSLLATAVVLVAAPAGARADTGDPAPTCTVAPPGPLQLTATDAQGTFCVLTGQRITVALSVNPDQFPNPANWWTAVTATGDAVAALPNTVMPARGVTLAHFVAAHRGEAVLSSTWSICPPPPQPPCGAPVRLWRVTIEVRGWR